MTDTTRLLTEAAKPLQGLEGGVIIHAGADVVDGRVYARLTVEKDGQIYKVLFTADGNIPGQPSVVRQRHGDV